MTRRVWFAVLVLAACGGGAEKSADSGGLAQATPSGTGTGSTATGAGETATGTGGTGGTATGTGGTATGTGGTATGTGTGGTPAMCIDRWDASVDRPVDLLFAMDQSCSMEDTLDELSGAFPEIFGVVQAATADWHIGVVTVDEGCFNGGYFDASEKDPVSRFDRAMGIGGGLFEERSESLLQLSAIAALQDKPEGCNEGFIRPEALLHVVVMSDEREQSGDPAGYRGYLEDMKVESHLLTISAIVDVSASCGVGDADDGAAGYLEAVEATGGLALDLCDPAWVDRAAGLGNASLTAQRRFPLLAPPVVDSLEVWADGAEAGAGWEYDPADNAVLIDATLDDASDIELRYLPLGTCG
ncbi:MAG: hypothetical protein ACI8PZ_003052 [Myxococcota bacterium]|jgi:hypothetical protein